MGLIGTAIYGALKLFKFGSAGSQIRYQTKGIKYKSGKLMVNVAMINPTSQPFTLKAFAADITTEDKATRLGIVSYTNATGKELAANATTIIPFTIAPEGTSLVKYFFNLLTQGAKSTKLGKKLLITGTYNVNNVNLPYNDSIALG